MTGRVLRFWITALTTLIFLALCATCVFGFMHSKTFDQKLTFGAAVLRAGVMLVFLYFYYASLFSSLGTDSAFLPMFIQTSIVAEFRILPLVTELTALCPYNPVIVSTVIMFCYLLSGLCIFCFGFFYAEKDQMAINKFLSMAIAMAMILAVFLPKSQDISAIRSGLAFSILFASIYTSAGVFFLHHIITDPPGTYLIRHFSALIFLVANVFNFYFTTRNAILGATAFTLISYLTIMIVSKVSDIKY